MSLRTRQRHRSTAPDRGSPRGRRRTLGGLIGILVAAVALGVGQLVAAFIAQPSSPVLAVGQTAIDASPEWLKSFAIRTFGSQDKTALLIGIVAILSIGSAVLGVVAVRRPGVGFAGLGVLGAVGMAAALVRPSSSPAWAFPSLVAAGAGAAAFVALRRAAGIGRERTGRRVARPSPEAPAGFDRRRFLQAALALSATAGVGDGLAVLIDRRRAAEVSRASVRIPFPASPAPRLAPDTRLRVPGLSPFFTPDDHFYRVDTTLLVPRVPAETWRLRIHGMVDREMEIDYPHLLARPMIERDVTLNCVSNPVGGRYIGNARWIGAPLAPLLEEAGVHSGADQIATRSVDGMTIGTPTAIALDGRDSMLAVAMNGQPLPFEHGFPVRVIVPGLYGYESATKWVVDIELTTLAAFHAYWVQRGWAQVAPIQTSSRIDTPTEGAHVTAGIVQVAGVAWAQHRGIERVEVRVDGGPWTQATLSRQDTIDTWRQWAWSWDATPGSHSLEVRATDGTGAVQTGTSAQPFPSGATGWHRLEVGVS